MVRPLDSLAFHAYVRRLGFTHRTQELLAHIRSSPPSRIPGARHGNMPVWYPSKKMQCVIKAESAKVEFAFLLQAEHDDDVLEIWDQPPSIPLAYRDRRNRLQRPLHTADYFVFRSRACGWIECKPTQELVKQVVTRPHRYRLDEQGRWRCPPGEAFAEEYGLTYHIWASDQIRWAAQDNWLFLEDYYQDLECLAIPETVLARLTQVVAAHPGILLADLRVAADLPADLIHVAIARHALYVDLARHRLSDPWHTPVFPDRRTARAYEHRAAAATRSPSVSATVLRPGRLISWDGRTWQIAEVGPTEIRLAGAGSGSFPLARSALEALVRDGTIALRALEEAGPASIAAAGRSLLERARDVDLATAVFRNRVIHPEQYADDAQESVAAPAAATIPARTKRRWRQWYAEAEDRYGSGFIGLIPQFARAGRKRAASAAD
ncbi:MAG TPA: hypothetical protein VNL71_23250, partial [Chloroflexota bacterium]|nr:hypothetical protein [Chloroflexota bacterium]